MTEGLIFFGILQFLPETKQKKKTRACGSEADLDPDFFLSDPEQGGKKDLQT